MELPVFFRENPECAVAFSGGVDSACLLYAAATYARRTAAYYVKTPFQPDFEQEDAEAASRCLGVTLRVIPYDILTVPEVASNPEDRCYHCKRALFTLLKEAAAADGYSVIADGSNASDDATDRPGMRALEELGIRSPLRESGLTKADIRVMAREAGLPIWDKPSYACLATRIPHGTAITAEDLSRAARGEAVLSEGGLSDFRLRVHGRDGLLQVREEQMELARRILPLVEARLAAEFHHIALDNTPRPSRET